MIIFHWPCTPFHFTHSSDINMESNGHFQCDIGHAGFTDLQFSNCYHIRWSPWVEEARRSLADRIQNVAAFICDLHLTLCHPKKTMTFIYFSRWFNNFSQKICKLVIPLKGRYNHKAKIRRNRIYLKLQIENVIKLPTGDWNWTNVTFWKRKYLSHDFQVSVTQRCTKQAPSSQKAPTQ